jgi:hypothetical protein
MEFSLLLIHSLKQIKYVKLESIGIINIIKFDSNRRTEEGYWASNPSQSAWDKVVVNMPEIKPQWRQCEEVDESRWFWWNQTPKLFWSRKYT